MARLSGLVRLVLFTVVAGLAVCTNAVAQPINLFASGDIQEVRLFVHSRDLEHLRARYLENTFYPADVQWGDARVRNVALRSRGGGSRTGTKPGLLLEFDRYVSGQRFGARRAVVLDNMWQDASMMREFIAMSVFAHMGQPAPLESYCRVYINGEYHGLYTIVEAIDADFLARTGADVRTTLHEYHWTRPYRFEPLGDDLTTYKKLFEARTNTSSPAVSLYGPVQDAIAAINTPPGEHWRREVERYIDLPQVLTHAAIETFLSESDGLLGYDGINNLYLSRSPGESQHRIVPWDRDQSFQEIEASIFRRVDEHALIRRALTFPDLYSHFLDELERTARAAAGGWLEDQVRATAAMIEPLAAHETRSAFPAAERAVAVAHLHEFARRRVSIVLQQVARAREFQALEP